MMTAMPSRTRRLPWTQVSPGPWRSQGPGVDAVPVRGPASVGGNARDTTGPSLTGADHYRAYQRGVHRPAIAVLLRPQGPLLRQALRAIDQHVDDYINQARLGKAA